MRGESSSFASSAFNVVNSGCLSNHSLAHEVATTRAICTTGLAPLTLAHSRYSYGYRRCLSDGTGFRT